MTSIPRRLAGLVAAAALLGTPIAATASSPASTLEVPSKVDARADAPLRTWSKMQSFRKATLYVCQERLNKDTWVIQHAVVNESRKRVDIAGEQNIGGPLNTEYSMDSYRQAYKPGFAGATDNSVQANPETLGKVRGAVRVGSKWSDWGRWWKIQNMARC